MPLVFLPAQPYLARMRVLTSPILAVAAAATCLAVAIFFYAPVRSDGRSQPVLVELFTSQGCYSCPPADRALGRLAAKGEVVALAFHVNYWDRLGWPDPFATEWGTQRQRRYGETVSEGRVYTPQMVIDGQTHEIDSNERGVRFAIARAARLPRPATPLLAWAAPDRVRIALPAAAEAAGADIWLARFDRRRETEILRGENGGKRLAYHQIVRERQTIGRYDGRAQSMEVQVMPGEPANWGVAVIVQQAGPGRVWGAGLLNAPEPDA